MSMVGTIGAVSPFIGLFGTVLGIMRAFRDIGTTGSAGGAVVAAGVAEALVTTATGLFVAVIAVIAYNHLMTWAESIITNTELNAQELVSLLGEPGRPSEREGRRPIAAASGPQHAEAS